MLSPLRVSSSYLQLLRLLVLITALPFAGKTAPLLDPAFYIVSFSTGASPITLAGTEPINYTNTLLSGQLQIQLSLLANSTTSVRLSVLPNDTSAGANGPTSLGATASTRFQVMLIPTNAASTTTALPVSVQGTGITSCQYTGGSTTQFAVGTQIFRANCPNQLSLATSLLLTPNVPVTVVQTVAAGVAAYFDPALSPQANASWATTNSMFTLGSAYANDYALVYSPGSIPTAVNTPEPTTGTLFSIVGCLGFSIRVFLHLRTKYTRS